MWILKIHTYNCFNCDAWSIYLSSKLSDSLIGILICVRINVCSTWRTNCSEEGCCHCTFKQKVSLLCPRLRISLGDNVYNHSTKWLTDCEFCQVNKLTNKGTDKSEHSKSQQYSLFAVTIPYKIVIFLMAS